MKAATLLAGALVLAAATGFAPTAQAHLCYEGAACGPCTEGHHHHLNPDDHSPYCESDDQDPDPDPDPDPEPTPRCAVRVKVCLAESVVLRLPTNLGGDWVILDGE